MNVTFDTETLGKNSKAPIVQIAAVAFDNQGRVLDSMVAACDINTIPKGLIIDKSTLKWWFGQMADNPKLAPVMSGHLPHKEMMNKFRVWVKEMEEIAKEHKESVFYWSHASFDPAIVKSNLAVHNLPDPIFYRNHMDIRTLNTLAGEITLKREGNFHNALDDCKHQAKYIAQGFKQIAENGISVKL